MLTSAQTLVQRLAYATKRDLVVQNLSLQTDSTDLLGGYRPLEIRHLARRVYVEFVDIFVSSFSKTQNAEFLSYVCSAYEKGQWKRLSQCFRRAARMGQDKMRELGLAAASGSSKSSFEVELLRLKQPTGPGQWLQDSRGRQLLLSLFGQRLPRYECPR